MAIDYHRLRNWQFAETEQVCGWKDCAIYALGVGYGFDPLDARQLRFVYEHAMAMVPTMPVVLASPGFWLKEQNSGVDWVKVLHGEQSLRIHRPIAVGSTVVGRMRVTGIVDKGRDKGAILVQERTLHDKATGELLATLESLTFARGDGGEEAKPMLAGSNTTIGVIATDAPLSKARAQRLAGAGHDGLARAIRPVHTMSDGDTLFALSTGHAPAIDFNVLCAMASEAVARACVNAVRAAQGLQVDGLWLPSGTDLEAARA